MKLLLVDDIEECMCCPLRRMNYKEGYFYCSHIGAPGNHLIKKVELKDKDGRYVEDFDLIEDYMPDWCPLPESRDFWNSTVAR